MISWYKKQRLIYQIAQVITLGFLLSFAITLYLLSYDKTQRISQLSTSSVVQRVNSVIEILAETPEELHTKILTASSGNDLQLSVSDEPILKKPSLVSPQEKKLKTLFQSESIKDINLALTTQSLANISHNSPQGLRLHQQMMMSMRQGERHNMNGSGSMVMLPVHTMGNDVQFISTFVGSIQIAPQQWLNFSSGVESQATYWSTSVIIILIGIMLMTLCFALVTIRGALRPIEDLGNSAIKFAKDKQVHPVPLMAAKDLVPTISAFNQMQSQVFNYIKERTSLLAAISHDLRTPLTSLRLRAEFIQDSEDKTQLLKTINTMDKMLTSTLTFAKNDAQNEHRNNVDIDSLLSTIVDEYEDRGIHINYISHGELVGNIPQYSVRRMLENLINNAHQHAGTEASISIAVEKNKRSLRLCVSDNGPGIPSDKFADMLKPFTRLSSARDTDNANMGLGLSITSTLAQKYGGELILEPNQPTGLCATVVISHS